MDVDRIVKTYVKIRDAKTALAREFEEKEGKLKAQLEKLEQSLLLHLNTHKQDSVKTAHGTFYKQEEIKPSAADWDVVYTWIKEHDAFGLLEKRLTKTFVKEYMEDHEGGIPPGINVHREYVVRVRRGNK